jgi:ribosomal protein S18 acetylase RimI-like enzyme
MVIEALAPRHVDAVARLHVATLTGLLASLGLRAARAYYAGAVRSPLMIGFVGVEGGTVRGFVLGSMQPARFRADVVRANRIAVLVGLGLGIARRPSVLRLLLPGAGPGEGAYDPRQPELTYLAVTPEGRGSGVGRRLVAAFGDGARQAGAQSYELSVDNDNQAAIGFYERLGFRLIGRYHEFGTEHRRYRLDLARG